MSETLLYALPVFRFHVEFHRQPLAGGEPSGNVPLCAGAFGDCTGLEATMEPKTIKVGGANYGAAQRPGPVTFATVVLKRGMTTTRDLWTWFARINQEGRYALRFCVLIKVAGHGGNLNRPAWTVRLDRALPVKFKAADLNARGQEVGIEELHLVHEGLTILPAP